MKSSVITNVDEHDLCLKFSLFAESSENEDALPILLVEHAHGIARSGTS
jgi:hypothetical protein